MAAARPGAVVPFVRSNRAARPLGPGDDIAEETEGPMPERPERRARTAAHREPSPSVRRVAEVRAVVAELDAQGRFGLTRDFIQHGTVSVRAHVIAVALASLRIADALGRMGIRTDRAALIRGALLHDYFLYDWHDPDPSHRLHGFTHPFAALARAEEDYDLTSRERTIIKRHMFPLVPIPPTCREAWIVCLADKACALSETVSARLPRRAAADGGSAA